MFKCAVDSSGTHIMHGFQLAVRGHDTASVPLQFLLDQPFSHQWPAKRPSFITEGQLSGGRGGRHPARTEKRLISRQIRSSINTSVEDLWAAWSVTLAADMSQLWQHMVIASSATVKTSSSFAA